MTEGHPDDQTAALPGLHLTDGVVELRPLGRDDARQMAAAADDPGYIAWGPVRGPIDQRRALAFVREWERDRRGGRRLALTLRLVADGSYLGAALLMVSGEAEAELAYWVRRQARRRGHATRALRLLADAAERLGFRRLWLEIEPRNRASRGVARAAGFLPAGRRLCDLGDGPVECEIFARTAPAAPLPPGYSVRRPTLEDVDAVVAVMNDAETADCGEPETTRAGLLGDWQGLPHFEVERDTWVIEALDGALAAYVWSWDERPHEWLISLAWIAPPHRLLGLEEHILDLLERRAVEHALEAPAQSADLGVVCLASDAAAQELYRRRGFRHTRTFERMSIDLAGPLPEPVWPPGIEVRTFRRGLDEAPVHEALDDAFSEHFRSVSFSLPDWERLMFALDGLDLDLWFVAWDGDRVAGTICCLSLKGDGIDYGHVEELGVRRPWRNRGLGTALMLQGLAALRERGHGRATLGVDTANVTDAQRLYERLGMRTELRREFFEKRVLAPPAPPRRERTVRQLRSVASSESSM